MYQSMLNYLFELERTGKKNVEKTETPVKETVVIVPRTNSGFTPTKNCDTCRSCFRDIRYNKDLPIFTGNVVTVLTEYPSRHWIVVIDGKKEERRVNL